MTALIRISRFHTQTTGLRSRFSDYFKRIDQLRGPPPTPAATIPKPMPKPPARRTLPNTRHIILVASGKGGVGKSTVSANLAVSLSVLGKRVALLDADVFGPSIPRLMGLTSQMARTDDQGKLIPLLNHGVHCMSMGFLMETEKDAVVWRGMMVMKALQQLIFSVAWHPDTEFLIIDMPPGTGDTQLTVSQLLHVDAAVIVTTPQDIALSDARKGITMFRKVNVPILGLVQNMSTFVCPKCHEETEIFGSAGGDKLASETGVEVIADIPLHASICQDSDKGKPVVLSQPDSALSKPYLEIAKRVISTMESLKVKNITL